MRLNELCILLIHPHNLFVHSSITLNQRCLELLYVFQIGASTSVCIEKLVTLLLSLAILALQMCNVV